MNLNIDMVCMKLKYYRQWYASLTNAERNASMGKETLLTLGGWLLQRIDLYVEAIDDDFKKLKAA